MNHNLVKIWLINLTSTIIILLCHSILILLLYYKEGGGAAVAKPTRLLPESKIV